VRDDEELSAADESRADLLTCERAEPAMSDVPTFDNEV
jgi:hypothetical protein